MVKVVKVMSQAAFLSQMRTLTVSEKARKQMEIALARKAVEVIANKQASDSYKSVKAVHVDHQVAETHLRNKTLRFDVNFFGDLLNHLAAQPSDGSFIPSRRHVLSNILHSKMEQGTYSSSKRSAGLTWSDVDSLLSDLIRLRMMAVSSPLVDCVESDLDDISSRIAELSRKVSIAQALKRCEGSAASESWTVKVSEQCVGYDTAEAERMDRLRGVDGCRASKQVNSFSTAPIWYQQAMENGPPLKQPRREEKASEALNNNALH